MNRSAVNTQQSACAAVAHRTAVKKPRTQRKIDAALRTVWIVLAAFTILFVAAVILL